MPRIALLLFLLLTLTIPFNAQSPATPTPTPVPDFMPKELVGAGATWNQYSAPSVMPFAFYAHRLTGPLYSYTEYMATSIQRQPLRVQFSGMTGAAVYIRQYGRAALWGLVDVGGSHVTMENGTESGFSYSMGGMATMALGRGWTLLVPVRTVKANLPPTAPPGSSNYQFKFSVAAAWGR